MPPVRGKRGRPRRRSDVVLDDRGYDHDEYRRLVWDLGVEPWIARRGTEHGSGLGTDATSYSAHSPICTGSAVCGSAGKAATASTKPSSLRMRTQLLATKLGVSYWTLERALGTVPN